MSIFNLIYRFYSTKNESDFTIDKYELYKNPRKCQDKINKHGILVIKNAIPRYFIEKNLIEI